jgi:phosphoglycerol transferase
MLLSLSSFLKRFESTFFWVFGAIFSFFFASILVSGWPNGLLPNLEYPFSFSRGGDGAFTDWGVQRLIEGWIFNNPRSGYPFGSNFLDYPNSDVGGFLILKFLGMLSGKYYVATNLFFLLSFPVIFLASFFTLRSIQLNSWISLAGSLVYTFAPFHFLKAGHIFYTWYFVVPIFYLVAFKIFEFNISISQSKNYLSYFAFIALVLIIVSSFGVYYALFGVIVIGTGGLAGALRHHTLRPLFISIAAMGTITFGVILNISPNLINAYSEGKNPEAVSRSLYGSEIYGFKIVQLLLPRHGHRVEPLAKLNVSYSNATPLVTENYQASLGIIGSSGLLILAIVLVRAVCGGSVDNRLRLLSLIGIVLVLFGTIGGFGSLFSMLISTSIRAWNRISIFISFAAITAFFICLQLLIEKRSTVSQKRLFYPLSSLLFVAFALFDQTTWACKGCNDTVRLGFNTERSFIQELENKLPPGAAIYQLPYFYFPENPGLYRLPDYEHAVGMANSKNLHWSYGGMKGRNGDLFYRALAKEPIEKQLEVIQNLGFNAIYIDRRGFSDNANALIAQLKQIIGNPIATRSDDEIVVFQILPTNKQNLLGLPYEQIVDKSNFTLNRVTNVYPASIEDGIDFRRDGYPNFLSAVSGIDAQENWGRWSNANLSPSVKLVFKESLPKKFTLEMNAIGYGPNINAKTKIQIGDQIQYILLQANANQPYKLQFENIANVNTIEIDPSKPTSPNQLSVLNSDTRKIGIGLISLKIIPN